MWFPRTRTRRSDPLGLSRWVAGVEWLLRERDEPLGLQVGGARGAAQPATGCDRGQRSRRFRAAGELERGQVERGRRLGLVASDRARAVLGDEGLAAYGATVPVGRAGTPADIAHACLFLASAQSDYITGTTIKMDGGSTVAASPGRADILQERLKIQQGKAP